MRAELGQIQAIQKLTDLGFRSPLLGGAFRMNWETASRAWSGAYSLKDDQIDWLTKLAAWSTRNPIPTRKPREATQWD